MNESVTTNNYAKLVTLSDRENDASEIESYLRKNGLPVRMIWLKPAKDIADQLRSLKPDMLFCDQRLLSRQEDLLSTCTRTLPYSPVLLLSQKIDTETVTRALHQRARDVVSVNWLEHLHAVYLRELGVCRLQQHLNDSLEEIDSLEERLEGLVSSSEAAVLNVQEGIIVEANPRFAELFGFQNVSETLGLPFLDHIAVESQKLVKKLMSKCLKGRKIPESMDITAIRNSGEEFKADMEINLVQFEGETSIELHIKTRANVANTTQASAAPVVDVAPPEITDTPTQVSAAETPRPEPAPVVRKAETPKASVAADKPQVDPRIAFYKSLENPKHYPPNGQGLSLGYFVVDNSVKLKEQLGLAGTDHFLGRITSFLEKQLPGAKIYRLSTDEFALVAPGKLFKHGETLAKNFCKQVSEEIFEFENQSVMVTISIAITLIDLVENSGNRFAEAREAARNLSASGGNSTVVCASARQSDQTDQPMQWKELQHAVDNNRIRIATRPIASLEGDPRTIYEIYPRMPNEKGTLSAIENDGPQDTHKALQVALDKKIIQLALGLMKKRSRNNELSGFFAPISSCSLEHEDDFFNWLQNEVKQLGLKDQSIVLTVSEEVLMPHIHRLKSVIPRLESSGIHIAISDCKGDAQSIKLIQNIPGHFLRLTTAATRALCEAKSSKKESLHEAVSIAKEHGYKIIAAATDDAHSMAVLWQLGVNYVESAEVEEPKTAVAA